MTDDVAFQHDWFDRAQQGLAEGNPAAAGELRPVAFRIKGPLAGRLGKHGSERVEDDCRFNPFAAAGAGHQALREGLV